MSMTHYMELLTDPWHLLFFMAIPIFLAETLAITEFYILYTNARTGAVRTINRVSGIILGIYFSGIFIYLLVTAVVPLNASGGWRGWIDVLAVGSYLAGVLPLAAIALLEMGVLCRRATPHQKLGIHALLISVFLVVGHVAMVAGMLDPKLGGWLESAASTEPHGGMHGSH